jgi:hypothetical protein
VLARLDAFGAQDLPAKKTSFEQVALEDSLALVAPAHPLLVEHGKSHLVEAAEDEVGCV